MAAKPDEHGVGSHRGAVVDAFVFAVDSHADLDKSELRLEGARVCVPAPGGLATAGEEPRLAFFRFCGGDPPFH